MAMRMGIRELRDNQTAAIHRVRDGETTIEATSRGELVAAISPAPTKSQDRLLELIASGQATAPRHASFEVSHLRARPESQSRV